MPNRYADPNYNDDTTYTPTSIFKSAKNVVMLFAGILVNVILISIMIYIAACYFDNRPPTQVYEYKADDTYLGGRFHVFLAGYRLRSCEITLYRWATDVNGNIIYEGLVERPVNGELNKPLKLDESFPTNARTVAGAAQMHQLFQWRCPYNIIHKYVQPLELRISDNFYIYENKEAYDQAKAKELAEKEAKEKEGKQ